MSKRWYGNVSNRLNEGKNFTGRDIQVGDDITMFYWSDRHCYYITKVIDQKHIFVKEYHICADHDKAKGMGHQDWKYFKTAKDEADYLRNFFPDREYDNYKESAEEEWAFRNNKWKSVSRWNSDTIKKFRDETCFEYPRNFTEKDIQKLDSGKEVVKYTSLQPVSFGVKDYHYDWEF